MNINRDVIIEWYWQGVSIENLVFYYAKSMKKKKDEVRSIVQSIILESVRTQLIDECRIEVEKSFVS